MIGSGQWQIQGRCGHILCLDVFVIRHVCLCYLCISGLYLSLTSSYRHLIDVCSVLICVMFDCFHDDASYCFRVKLTFLPSIRSIAEDGRYVGFCFFLMSGYRYLGKDGTIQREISHDGTYWSRT